MLIAVLKRHATLEACKLPKLRSNASHSSSEATLTKQINHQHGGTLVSAPDKIVRCMFAVVLDGTIGTSL